MKYLFDGEGMTALEQIKSFRALYAFDFDGTLCPIVPSPELAILSDSVLDRLCELSQIAPVAVISGRSLSDLRERLDCEEIRLFGNHGAEGLLSVEAARDATRICAGWVRSLNEADPSSQSGQEFLLEDKGLSISLHYRHSTDKKRTRALLEEKIARLQPMPRVVSGKFVLNLVPETNPNKGVALRSLLALENLDRALFVGDDVTDEDIFSMNDERVISVRVSPLKESKAQFFLKSQDEVERLLDFILSAGMPEYSFLRSLSRP